MSSEQLCRQAIEQWITSNCDSDLPTGCTVEEATGLASDLLRRVDADPQTTGIEWSPEIIDVLHAACRILRLDSVECRHPQGRAIRLYVEVEKIRWASDLFDERDQILASLAFEAWNECRLAGQFDLMREFEARCEKHTLRQDLLREFLARPLFEWPERLRSRLLSEPVTLLANVTKLERLRNVAPKRVSEEAPLLRDWLLAGGGSGLREEERGWLASQIAILQSGSLRLLGELGKAKRWLDAATQTFAPLASFDLLKVQAELTMLAISYDGGALEAALAGVPSLRSAADKGRMAIESLKVRFLEANLLKDLGSPLALGKFTDLVQTCRARSDSLHLGLCLVKIADLNASQGDITAAMRDLKEAGPLLESAGVAWGIAHLHGTIGEVLRDQGHLEEAIEAYRLSLRTFLSGQFSCRSAYLRIVLAETLILAGREEEALVELIAALPLIERESLAREGVAAVALLREALLRKKTDSVALRILRKQMDPIGSGDKS